MHSEVPDSFAETPGTFGGVQNGQTFAEVWKYVVGSRGIRFWEHWAAPSASSKLSGVPSSICAMVPFRLALIVIIHWQQLDNCFLGPHIRFPPQSDRAAA